MSAQTPINATVTFNNKTFGGRLNVDLQNASASVTDLSVQDQQLAQEAADLADADDLAALQGQPDDLYYALPSQSSAANADEEKEDEPDVQIQPVNNTITRRELTKDRTDRLDKILKKYQDDLSQPTSASALETPLLQTPNKPVGTPAEPARFLRKRNVTRGNTGSSTLPPLLPQRNVKFDHNKLTRKQNKLLYGDEDENTAVLGGKTRTKNKHNAVKFKHIHAQKKTKRSFKPRSTRRLKSTHQ